MRRFRIVHILLALALVILAYGAGVASEYLTQDRAWWQGDIPDASRVYVIEGAIDSYQSGWSDGVVAEGDRISTGARNVFSAAQVRELHDIVYKKGNDLHYVAFASKPTFSKKFGAYVDGMDGFYRDYPNASAATIGAILACLADSPATSCSDTAKYAQ